MKNNTLHPINTYICYLLVKKNFVTHISIKIGILDSFNRENNSSVSQVREENGEHLCRCLRGTPAWLGQLLAVHWVPGEACVHWIALWPDPPPASGGGIVRWPPGRRG